MSKQVAEHHEHAAEAAKAHIEHHGKASPALA